LTAASPAPATFTTLLDVSAIAAADQNQGRIDGTLAGVGASATTPGLFTSQVLNIGRRNGGASLCFNGRLSVLTCRGSSTALSNNLRNQMEQCVARKTGRSFTSS
jgi:hypothetical protein